MKESKKEEPGTKRRFRRVEGAVWQEPWEERALSRTEQPLEWTIKSSLWKSIFRGKWKARGQEAQE